MSSYHRRIHVSTEEWRRVVGFEQYYHVSSHGRVRSYAKSWMPSILKPAANESGHLFLYLGSGRKRYVHRLVLEAFKGPCPPGFEGLHGDDDPSNNHEDNLAWGTRSDNLKARHRAYPGMAVATGHKSWETRRAKSSSV